MIAGLHCAACWRVLHVASAWTVVQCPHCAHTTVIEFTFLIPPFPTRGSHPAAGNPD
jgi:phage FluMu protein Com